MSNFTRFNIKHSPACSINMGYQGREQYLPLSAISFKKATDLYAINPDMTYTIRALYLSKGGTYGDQLVAIVEPEYPVRTENASINAINLHLDGVFRMALPRKYVGMINPDDAGLIDDCNKGLARFRITQYHSKRFNKDLNDIEFL